MKKLSNPALIVVVLTLAFASAARAQATRTWVSGVGDDANPCSRTAPCKTFAGAISKTAPGGEIDALDDGGFGAVTITKSITIEGGGHTAGVLAALTNGININAGSGDTIALRNLDINGAGTGLIGINIISAKAVHIDNCQIYGFKSGTGRAIHDGATVNTNTVFVNDSYIRDNLGGIGITGSASSLRAFIRNCRIQNNGFGVLGSNTSSVTLQSSILTGNTGDAFKVDVSATGVVVGSLFTNNLSGVIVSGAAGVFMADATIINNSTGVSGNIVTFGNNNVRNNAGGNTLAASVGQQ